MSGEINIETMTLLTEAPATKDWRAWNNRMPPAPFSFHIHGLVQIPNLGVVPILSERTPPGINPTIIIFDLFLIQKPGAHARPVTWRDAHRTLSPSQADFERAEVHFDGKKIADIKVETVS